MYFIINSLTESLRGAGESIPRLKAQACPERSRMGVLKYTKNGKVVLLRGLSLLDRDFNLWLWLALAMSNLKPFSILSKLGNFLLVNNRTVGSD